MDIKTIIAWLPGFLSALAGQLIAKAPASFNDWMIAVLIGAGFGFTGNIAKGANKAIDNKQP